MATDDIEERMQKVHWVPLESNPQMLTDFGRKVGLPEPWEFTDIFGVDEDMLSMVPPGAVAVTLLFQCSRNLEQYKLAQKGEIEANGQVVGKSLTYLKQYVGNACGTIASIHSMANNAEVLGIAPSSPLGRFLQQIQGKSPQEAGSLLADAKELHEASEVSAQGGQTEAPEATAATDHHFIAFVEKEGDIYELDGAKAFPINHGSAGGNLLKAAAKVIQEKFMDKDPDNIQFNMMALVRGEEP